MTNCQVIVIFPNYGQFEQSGSRMLDVYSVKLTFSLIVFFYLTKTKSKTKNSFTKTENRTKNSPTQLSHNCFEQRYYFCQKWRIFAKTVMTSAKLRGSWYKKYFFWICRCVYLRTKCQVSSIILTSFRQAVLLPPPSPLPPPTSKRNPLKSPRRLGLNNLLHCYMPMLIIS